MRGVRGVRGVRGGVKVPNTSFLTVVRSFLTDSGSSISGSPIERLLPLKHAAMWN